MDRLKRIKGIIAAATAVFMLLSFCVPDMGIFGVMEVKAATYSAGMGIDELFKSESTGSSNSYFTVTDEAVTIINGTYQLAQTSGAAGFVLSKDLYINGGTIDIKQYSGGTDHTIFINTAGHDVKINGGEISSNDSLLEGVIRCTGATDDTDESETDESTVTITGGKISGGKYTIFIDSSFDGKFHMTGGSIINDSSSTDAGESTACIYAADETSSILIEGGSVTKTGTSIDTTKSSAINITGGTAVIGNGTDPVNITSSETGILLDYEPGMDDKYNGTRDLTVKAGAKISASGCAVGNSAKGTVNDAAKASSITIKGGEIKSVKAGGADAGGVAVYHAGYGTLTVEGGVIEGSDCGIEVRNGKLDVKGGTIKNTSTGNAVTAVTRFGGSTTSGAGIAIAPYNTYADIAATISGGTVEGIGALYVSNPNKAKYVGANTGTGTADTTGYGDEGEGYKFALAVTGGTFMATGTDQKAAEIIIDDVDKGMTVGSTEAAALITALGSAITAGTYNTSEDEYAASALKSAVFTTKVSGTPKSLYLYGASANSFPAAKNILAKSTVLAKGDKVRITKGTGAESVTLPSLVSLKWYASDETETAAGAVAYKTGTAAENTYTIKADNPAVVKDTAALEVNKTIKLADKVTGRPDGSTLGFTYKSGSSISGCSLSNTGITDTTVTNGVFNSGGVTGECVVIATVGATAEYAKKTAEITVSVTPHTHKGMARTAGKAATCTEDGVETIYTCSDCGKRYNDAVGTKEITDTTIKALGHDLTAVAAKTPTCLEDGNTAYWSCSRCGKVFSDSKGETATTLAAAKLAKLSHVTSYHGAKDATCSEDGNKAYWQCEKCESFFNDKEAKKPTTKDAVVIARLGHRMTSYPEYKATCEADGQKAYWTCSVCRKTYTDAAGTKELSSAADLVIAAKGHTIVEVAEAAPTCDKDGRKAHFKCSVCNKIFKDKAGNEETTEASMMIKAVGHSLTLHAAKDVDCTTDGFKTYWSCDTCDRLFLDIDGINETTLADVTVKCEGHKMTEHKEEKGDCVTDGRNAYWDCSVCGRYFADKDGVKEMNAADIFVPAPGHKPVHYPAKSPTKTAAGNTEYWKCSACGICFADEAMKNEITEDSTKIPAADHVLVKHEEISADCEKDGRHAYWECTDCEKCFADAGAETETSIEELTIPSVGHVWGPWVTTKLASKTEPGIKTRTCLRNELHIQTIGIPATGEDDPDTPVIPPAKNPGISYRAYVQKTGWQSYVRDGAVAGTKGKSLRLEALRIKLRDADGGIRYRVYIGKDGWQSMKYDGAVAGTMGKSKRLETIQAGLTGNAAVDYNLYYRVYVQRFGWLGWAKNGGSAGTRGYDYRIEAVQMKLKTRSEAAPSGASKAYMKRD